MPGDFLAQQMHWRESLDEAAATPAIEALAREVASEREARLRRVGQLLDERGDAAGAAREVRALMFIERFAEDIERRMETLGQ
jgi:molecular chaperone HscB